MMFSLFLARYGRFCVCEQWICLWFSCISSVRKFSRNPEFFLGATKHFLSETRKTTVPEDPGILSHPWSGCQLSRRERTHRPAPKDQFLKSKHKSCFFLQSASWKFFAECKFIKKNLWCHLQLQSSATKSVWRFCWSTILEQISSSVFLAWWTTSERGIWVSLLLVLNTLKQKPRRGKQRQVWQWALRFERRSQNQTWFCRFLQQRVATHECGASWFIWVCARAQILLEEKRYGMLWICMKINGEFPLFPSILDGQTARDPLGNVCWQRPKSAPCLTNYCQSPEVNSEGVPHCMHPNRIPTNLSNWKTEPSSGDPVWIRQWFVTSSTLLSVVAWSSFTCGDTNCGIYWMHSHHFDDSISSP